MNVLALSGRARSRALKTAFYVVLASLFLWLMGGWLVERLRLMTGTEWAEVLSNSLSLSSILILTALGLAITFGVMRVINMAHGDMLMLGAYTGYVVTDPHGLPALVSGLASASVLNIVLGSFMGDEGYRVQFRWGLSLSVCG